MSDRDARVEAAAEAIRCVIEAPNDTGLADAEIDFLAAHAALAAADAVQGDDCEHGYRAEGRAVYCADCGRAHPGPECTDPPGAADAVQARNAETFIGTQMGGGERPDWQFENLRCDRPPAGWECSRKPGHDGPCAAMPVSQPADDRRMVDLNAVIEALDDVASKVLPGSDPMACVRAAAGVIEREFGGPAPIEGRR